MKAEKNLVGKFKYTVTYLPWWLSCLDRDALNVNAQRCGTSVVRGPTGHSRKVFILGYSSKRPSSNKSESTLHQRGPLGRTVSSTDKAPL